MKWNKNKNESCIKLKMEVHSRNHYPLTIYFKLNKKGNSIEKEIE